MSEKPARSPEGIEIERKFLLRRLPPVLRPDAVLELEQGYLPGERLVERVRRVRDREGERFFRTVKGAMGLARVEIEEEASRELFAALWPLTLGRRVRKRRYKVRAGELVWELDFFLDRELVLAEVELPSEDTPVPIPEWLRPCLVREVTGNPEYQNSNLAD